MSELTELSEGERWTIANVRPMFVPTEPGELPGSPPSWIVTVAGTAYVLQGLAEGVLYGRKLGAGEIDVTQPPEAIPEGEPEWRQAELGDIRIAKFDSNKTVHLVTAHGFDIAGALLDPPSAGYVAFVPMVMGYRGDNNTEEGQAVGTRLNKTEVHAPPLSENFIPPQRTSVYLPGFYRVVTGDQTPESDVLAMRRNLGAAKARDNPFAYVFREKVTVTKKSPYPFYEVPGLGFKLPQMLYDADRVSNLEDADRQDLANNIAFGKAWWNDNAVRRALTDVPPVLPGSEGADGEPAATPGTDVATLTAEAQALVAAVAPAREILGRELAAAQTAQTAAVLPDAENALGRAETAWEATAEARRQFRVLLSQIVGAGVEIAPDLKGEEDAIAEGTRNLAAIEAIVAGLRAAHEDVAARRAREAREQEAREREAREARQREERERRERELSEAQDANAAMIRERERATELARRVAEQLAVARGASERADRVSLENVLEAESALEGILAEVNNAEQIVAPEGDGLAQRAEEALGLMEENAGRLEVLGEADPGGVAGGFLLAAADLNAAARQAAAGIRDWRAEFEGVRADLEGRLRLVRVRATELRDDPNALEVAIAAAKQTIEADGPALVRAAAAVDAVYPTAVLETLREQYERAISGMTPAERQAWARRLEGTVASVPGAFEAAKQAVPTELVDRVRGAVAVLHDNLDLGDYVGFFSEAGGQAQVLRNAEELHRLKERAEQDKALVTAAKNEANFILVGAGVREQLDALVAQLAAGVEPERLPLEPGDLDPATYTTVPSAFAGMAVASALAGAAEHLATQAVQYRLHEDAAKERGDEVLAAESASGKAEVAYVDRHTRENWQAHKDAVAAVAGAYGRYADAMTALSTGSATLRDAANDLGAKVIAWINSGEDARDKVPEVTAIVARIQRLRKHFLAQFVRDSEEAADVRKEKERRDAVARAFDMRNPPPEPRPPQPPAPVPQRSAWERAQDILNKPASEEPHRFALDDLTFISGADATLLERATDVGVAFAARGQLSDQLRSTEAAVGAAASESKTAGTVFTTAVAQTPRQTDPALTALLKAARDAAQTLLDDQRAALRLRALYATNSKTLLDAVNALRSGLEVSLLDQEGDQDRVEDAAHRVQALVRRGIELSRDDVTALSNAQAAVVSAQAVVDQREAWNISTPVFVPSGDVMTVAAAGVSFPESEEVLHVPMQFDVVINGGRLAGTAYPTYYGTTLSAGVGLLIEHVKGDLYAVGNRSAPQIIQRARTRDPSMASFTLGKLTTVFPVDRILAGGALTDAKDRTFVQVGLAGSELRYVLLGVKNPSHEDF